MKRTQSLLIQLFLLGTIVLLSSGTSCRKNAPSQGTDGPDSPSPDKFVKGADISWVSQMESEGRKFYNTHGTETDPFLLMQELGINTIRLRVWVNPSAGWNNQADVMAKAERAARLGMRLLIDFHYSDSWADPGKQEKPAAWTGMGFEELKTALAEHTRSVLSALKSRSIFPDWVAVGNETNDGLLWPEGKASSNMSNFAALIQTGYNAVKQVFPKAKVIVHLSNGYDNVLFRWIFDGLKSNGAQYDVIGMSLYPSPADWPALSAQCFANMKDLAARYGKEVVLCEVGMSWDQPMACKAFLTDLMEKIKSVPDSKGLGLLYWEPEAYNNWQGYTLGAFDNGGHPTAAMEAFR